MKKRSSGILMPISSLPSNYGIGTFGKEAYNFVDFLENAGQSYWQVLPLVPTGFGDSPYQSCSSAAGNPYFIDLELLCAEGLIFEESLEALDFGANLDAVDYGKLYINRYSILREAFESSREILSNDISTFVDDNKDWIYDYSLFMALKRHFNMKSLLDWPDAKARNRNPKTLDKYRDLLKDEIDFEIFLQYEFYKQWAALKSYANSKRIKIIGDIPFYVSEDSADLWANRELFEVRINLTPKLIAGVPPDYYSETGQLWGNPVYRWSAHKEQNYQWWIWRLAHNMKLYDTIRIDHFRAIHSFWQVPASAETAAEGRWKAGPGMEFLDTIKLSLSEIDLIAEDLCDINENLQEFFSNCGIPGMTVLIFSLNPETESSYLPHNAIFNSVAYTSTHDSDTFIGWLSNSNKTDNTFAHNYLRLTDIEGLSWGAIKCVSASQAGLVIFPMQDILGLGSDSRINTPSTFGGSNWQWRIRKEAINDNVAKLLRDITETYYRL